MEIRREHFFSIMTAGGCASGNVNITGMSALLVTLPAIALLSLADLQLHTARLKKRLKMAEVFLSFQSLGVLLAWSVVVRFAPTSGCG